MYATPEPACLNNGDDYRRQNSYKLTAGTSDPQTHRSNPDVETVGLKREAKFHLHLWPRVASGDKCSCPISARNPR